MHPFKEGARERDLPPSGWLNLVGGRPDPRKPIPVVHIRKLPGLPGNISFMLACSEGGAPLRCIL